VRDSAGPSPKSGGALRHRRRTELGLVGAVGTGLDATDGEVLRAPLVRQFGGAFHSPRASLAWASGPAMRQRFMRGLDGRY